MEEVLKQLQELKQLAIMQNKNVLNVSDLALLSGLSKSHIYKLVCAKRIPYYKSEGGKLTFFKKSEVEEWLCTYRVATQLENEQKALAYSSQQERGRL